MSVSAIGEHIRRNVLGYVALFIALSGTSYAATKVGTKTSRKTPSSPR